MANRRTVLEEVVDRYNRYRAPMARVSLRGLGHDAATVRLRFEGPFTGTCCPDEYLEDFRYELAALGVPPADTRWVSVRSRGPATVEATLEVDRPTPSDAA